jgi:hypothetical protein
MMHGHEKSDLAIVATKPANKAERSAAEPVERRAGAKGNAGQQGTHRTQNRASVSQALERIRRAVGNRARDITLTVTHLRWEPYALIGHVRICAGGAQQWASLPRHGEILAAWCPRPRCIFPAISSRRRWQHGRARVGPMPALGRRIANSDSRSQNSTFINIVGKARFP